jgi:hypothetical protein
MPFVGGQKKLLEFHYDLPQTAYGKHNMRATIFRNPEGTLWTHFQDIPKYVGVFIGNSN